MLSWNRKSFLAKRAKIPILFSALNWQSSFYPSNFTILKLHARGSVDLSHSVWQKEMFAEVSLSLGGQDPEPGPSSDCVAVGGGCLGVWLAVLCQLQGTDHPLQCARIPTGPFPCLPAAPLLACPLQGDSWERGRHGVAEILCLLVFSFPPLLFLSFSILLPP